MKALTILEPWASLLVYGTKQYETRSWLTKHRGPLAIHAGKGRDGLKLMESPMSFILKQEADKLGIDFEETLGHVIGIIDLANCIEMTPNFIGQQGITERGLGWWEPGRYAWEKSNVRKIDPVPVKGMQGLWNWDSQYEFIK